MSSFRPVAFVILFALASAVLVAFVGRAPERIRHIESRRAVTDPSLGAGFTDEQVSRHAAYRGPGYLALACSILVQILLFVALARGPVARMIGAIENVRGGILVHAALLGACVAVLVAAALLPLGFVRGLVMARAWGLSTQELAGWATDQVKSLLVGAVFAAVASAAFFGVVRWRPGSWWLWGWIGFTALTLAMTFLYPVAIAPLFNKFTPLDDAALAGRIKSLAASEGVDIGEVLVADASRRTTAENAYVAGLWGTKRMVLYDTLLSNGDDEETLFVAAHELGHEAEGHVWKGVALSSIGLLAGFAALGWLASRPGMWNWAGASGPADLKALPVLLLFALGAGLVALPAENLISRRHEGKADSIALEATGDPATAVRVFRRLALSNLADLRPPRAAVWLLYSHPPVRDRIQAALRESPHLPER